MNESVVLQAILESIRRAHCDTFGKAMPLLQRCSKEKRKEFLEAWLAFNNALLDLEIEN